MMNNKSVITVVVIMGGLVGLAVVAAVVWWLASPLWRTDEVNEAFPAGEVVISESGELVAPSREQIAAMDEDEKAAVQESIEQAAADMPDRTVEEEMPAEPVLIASGQVVGADDFHQGSGTASIYQLADGSYVLRLQDFEVTNGPDLHVFLSGSPQPVSRGDVMTAPSVDLGMLKGNVGDQNYPIPADVDIANVQSVVIYCVPFHVLFASATLSEG